MLAGCLGMPTGSPKEGQLTGERTGLRSSGGQISSARGTRRVLLDVLDETTQAALLERLPVSRVVGKILLYYIIHYVTKNAEKFGKGMKLTFVFILAGKLVRKPENKGEHWVPPLIRKSAK